ncbi:30S ribosomal protein S9 [Candidatus Dependentiae bacterium]|nr:MAG: 30S ribosomal protein S9 [Candidatus Dependentiae bacterium]
MKQGTKVKKVSKESSKPIAYGYGHRKTSKARVWLRRGMGKFIVNSKEMKEYFDTEITRLDAATPFRVILVGQNYDVEANVIGGGKCGQAGAVKLGIARALLQVDESLRPTLRQHNLLTVDSRQKERKKYGQRGARRKFQFVKR